MAEAAGLAMAIVSTVGVLGQCFDGCVKAYSYFTQAKNSDKDASGMVTKIKIEEMRLIVWGREWGVGEGKLDARMASISSVYSSPEVNEGIRLLAIEILQKLELAMTDYNIMRERYGVKVETKPEEPQGQTLKAPSLTNKGVGKSPSRATTWSAAGDFSRDLKRRAKWVVRDKEKFGYLLKDLKEYNDGLENLFPRSRIDSLQRAWVNELLRTASRDVSQLNLLEAASEGTYQQLNASANLKQLKINLDLEAEQPRKFIASAELKIPKSALQLKSTTSRGKHHATLQKGKSQEVIVEWMPFDPEADMETKMVLYQRMDFLARMLHSASNRHPDLHTIDCTGYYDDSAHERLGLVYLPPPSSNHSNYFTLKQVLTEQDTYKLPDLGSRFDLAACLAISLWSLHSLDWLHKAFSSENVLFFQDERPKSPPPTPSSQLSKFDFSAPAVSLANPRIVGFASSRPDHNQEMTVVSRNETSADLHRHPLSLGACHEKYRKPFDIYSLGVMLLEIGMWKPVKTFYSPRYSIQEFREKMLERAVPILAQKVGKRYQEVVRTCLERGDKDNGEESGKFMEWVVNTLESLTV